MFKNLKLLPVLIFVVALALVVPTFDYYARGATTWLSYVGVAPLALVVLYLLIAAVAGGIRDARR